MIPNVSITPEGFEISAQDFGADKTYSIDFDTGRMGNPIDETEALKQTIYCILRTERYAWTIYSRNYGIELDELYGQPRKFVMPKLIQRITDALMQDARIVSISEFHFSRAERNAIAVSFVVDTVYNNKINITDKVVI